MTARFLPAVQIRRVIINENIRRAEFPMQHGLDELSATLSQMPYTKYVGLKRIMNLLQSEK